MIPKFWRRKSAGGSTAGRLRGICFWCEVLEGAVDGIGEGRTGADIMSHPILSFDFGKDGRVCLSVETGKEQGESFTPVGGLHKILELCYLLSTEEDCIRVRTNIRKEPVHLDQMNSPISEIQEMFMTSVNIQNELNRRPRFYNVVSANSRPAYAHNAPRMNVAIGTTASRLMGC